MFQNFSISNEGKGTGEPAIQLHEVPSMPKYGQYRLWGNGHRGQGWSQWNHDFFKVRVF